MIGEVCNHINTFSVQTYVIYSFNEKVLRQVDILVPTGTILFRSLQRFDEEAICVFKRSPLHTLQALLEDRWFKIDAHGLKAETVWKYKL